VIGRAAREGRDKLTLICSPGIVGFGYWVEQLIAESTGKLGRGIVPVEGEPVGPPSVYGEDRVFVYLRHVESAVGSQDEAVTALEGAGQPVVRIELGDAYDLGGEFFRWELATATAGALLRVDPFDEPNVQESKDNTKRVLHDYDRTGALPPEKPLFENGLRLFAAAPTANAIRRAGDVPDALARFLKSVESGDYLAITAYLPRTPETEKTLGRIRAALRDRLAVATTLGYGPRFLHSTGQLHKGGPNTGVFVLLTDDALEDIAVPEAPYTFDRLRMAQALGDLQSLQAAGRRVAHVHLDGERVAALRALRSGLQ
jgi:hypothetical protein